MQACWIDDPLQRPTFTDLRNRLEDLIKEGTPYLEFEFDEAKPYYNVPSFRSIESDTEETCNDEDQNTMRFSVLKDKDEKENKRPEWLSSKAVEKLNAMEETVEKQNDRYTYPEMMKKKDEVAVEIESTNPLHKYVNTQGVVTRPSDVAF